MGKKSILMVDDSRLARMLLRNLIADVWPEWEILEAGDSAQALALMATRLPDVVLVDYNMPGMNGLELCLQLRERWPELPLHLVTANIQDKVRERAASHNIGFVNKPVSRESLRQVADAQVAS